MPSAQGTVQRARRWASRPVLDDRKMLFPTFSAATNDRLARHGDYMRLASILLALARTRAETVAGAIAEVGVWRGDTSVLLQAEAPERDLHLFDTFEGFVDRDLGELNCPEDAYRFRDTSVDRVRGRLPEHARVTLHPGLVPETLKAVQGETFAFVLLDLDVGAPTTASLEFFYPRMADGAYCFVHDYNSTESDWACKRALDGFLAGRPERVIDLPDRYGSAMFRRL